MQCISQGVLRAARRTLQLILPTAPQTITHSPTDCRNQSQSQTSKMQCSSDRRCTHHTRHRGGAQLLSAHGFPGRTTLHSMCRRTQTKSSTALPPASPQTITQPPTDCRNHRNRKNPKIQRPRGRALTPQPLSTNKWARSLRRRALFHALEPRGRGFHGRPRTRRRRRYGVAIETKPCLRPLRFWHLKLHLCLSAAPFPWRPRSSFVVHDQLALQVPNLALQRED